MEVRKHQANGLGFYLGGNTMLFVIIECEVQGCETFIKLLWEIKVCFKKKDLFLVTQEIISAAGMIFC